MLAEYQARLAAQDTYGVIMLLQAMDAAGKDGTIRHVMSGVNPQGVQVSSFKQPSATELDHDYLWRYARKLPERGNIGIFNRSYYEEVLVVRVHPAILDNQKLPRSARGAGIWNRRFREINDWERYLTDQGYRFVKLFLNLSREEQRRRFLSRIDEPDKNWKFSSADAREREHLGRLPEGVRDVLSKTSTTWAPWYVIPADDKPFARVAAAGVLAHTLIEIDPRYPEGLEGEARRSRGGEGCPRGPGSQGRRARSVRGRDADESRAEAEEVEGEGLMTASTAPAPVPAATTADVAWFALSPKRPRPARRSIRPSD